jgi:hypothetical protein
MADVTRDGEVADDIRSDTAGATRGVRVSGPSFRLRPADGASRSDRGQLFLIGALALAVLLIAVALLLNTAIYTENLATRSSGVDAPEMIEYQSAAHEHTTTEFSRVNDENVSDATPYDDIHSNYTASVDAWDEAAASQRSADGHVAALSLTNTTNGTRIAQDESRNFTSADGNVSWVLAEDAHARNYTMTVEQGSLTDTDLGNLLADGAYHVNFTAGSDVWSVYVYEGATSTVNVTVQDSGTTVGSCQSTATDTTINVTNASVNGQPCPSLAFFDDIGSDYDVSYGNASEVNGTYSLVVDREISAVEGDDYHDDDSGDSPYVTPVLYAVEFDLAYETPTAYYETDYRIAPGEPDA